MSNRRKLKRTINYICGGLFAEAVAASLYGESANIENIDSLMASILIMHNNYISRISHVEPGMPAKDYFNDLKNKFNKEVSEIIDQISTLG